ncbi:MAG: hypothetical protein F6K16_35105 [Symploca sp. SIO2B6]|nr:hypothetical protein [Symploca sp. SIO2B6]
MVQSKFTKFVRTFGVIAGVGCASLTVGVTGAEAASFSRWDHETQGTPVSGLSTAQPSPSDGLTYIDSTDTPHSESGSIIGSEWGFDRIRADSGPRGERSYTFDLEEATNILLYGFIREGHPERGCTLFGGTAHRTCNQQQKHESFDIFLNDELIFSFRDSSQNHDFLPDSTAPVVFYGEDENGNDYENTYYKVEEVAGLGVVGENTLTFRHSLAPNFTEYKTGADSVEYNFDIYALNRSEDAAEKIPEPFSLLGYAFVLGMVGIFRCR